MFFSGNSEEGFKLCSMANQGPLKSYLIDSCLGVSALNLKAYDDAYNFFNLARNRILSVENNDEIPFVGFYASKNDLETGLVYSLTLGGRFDLCTIWSRDILSIPPISKGGILILAIAKTLDLSKNMELIVPKLENIELLEKAAGNLVLENSNLVSEVIQTIIIFHLYINYNYLQSLGYPCC